MRHFKLLTTAALTLGTLALPTFARADRGHDDRGRDDHRQVDRHEVARDTHRNVVVERRPEVIRRDRVIVRDERPTVIVRRAPAVIVTDGDCDYGVALSNVPGCVIDTLDHHGFGGQVEAVQFVRRDGQTFYRFRIDDGRHSDLDVRIALDGDLLGIAPAA
jgi:hypothetical protein